MFAHCSFERYFYDLIVTDMHAQVGIYTTLKAIIELQ